MARRRESKISLVPKTCYIEWFFSADFHPVTYLDAGQAGWSLGRLFFSFRAENY